jgi:hypothetical protein
VTCRRVLAREHPYRCSSALPLWVGVAADAEASLAACVAAGASGVFRQSHAHVMFSRRPCVSLQSLISPYLNLSHAIRSPFVPISPSPPLAGHSPSSPRRVCVLHRLSTYFLLVRWHPPVMASFTERHCTLQSVESLSLSARWQCGPMGIPLSDLQFVNDDGHGFQPLLKPSESSVTCHGVRSQSYVV